MGQLADAAAAAPADRALADVAAGLQLVCGDAGQARCRADKRNAEIADSLALNRWAIANTSSSTTARGSEIIPEMKRGSLWPTGNGDTGFTVVKWGCPARELAEKATAAMARPGDLLPGTTPPMQVAMDAWKKRCSGIQLNNCMQLNTSTEKQKICYAAETCLCSSVAG